MTHAQALADTGDRWPGRDCPGELVPCGWYPNHGGLVATYHCPACDRMLSIEPDGRIRNVYPFPPAAEDEDVGS